MLRKRKPDSPVFETLLEALILKVKVLRVNMNYPRLETDRDVEIRARGQLRRVLQAPDPALSLGISMTSLLLCRAWRDIDKPDYLVFQYAVEFITEHRLSIAEAKMLEETVDDHS